MGDKEKVVERLLGDICQEKDCFENSECSVCHKCQKHHNAEMTNG